MSVLWVYALVPVPAPEPLGAGLAGEPLAAVACGGVAAVAGEMAAPPSVGAAALLGHDRVVRRLAGAAPALLPVRFGETVEDEAALGRFLTPRAGQVAEALARVAGCVQMTLRVWGAAEAEGSEAGGGEPEAPGSAPTSEMREARSTLWKLQPSGPEAEARQGEALGDAPGGSAPEGGAGPGTRYLAARRRSAERARSLPEIAPLRRALAPLLRGERVERPGAGPLLATAYDLVERRRVPEYLAVVEAGGAPAGLRVSWSGPWPVWAYAEEAR